MARAVLLECLTAVVAVAALVSYQVASQQVQGSLESLVLRAQDALQSWWRGMRDHADGVVRGVVRSFRRREHDALHSASVQLEELGVDVDLNEAGDDVNDGLYGCAKDTQAKYGQLLAQLRRRVQRCWGWESREVGALVRAVEELILAGDRLPALLRTSMAGCLQGGRRRRPRAADDGQPEEEAETRDDKTAEPPLPPPSPFRVLRCTADSVNLTWTYVTAVPREVGRAARRAASLLGSSREDWAECARGIARQTAGSAVQTLRELGACVAGKVSEESWLRAHRAWQNPQR